jgi:sugar fermentation stimulation protein A
LTKVAGELTLVTFIKIQGRILEAFFKERPNRFLAIVKIEGKTLPAFLPNPGRMHELLKPGAAVVLREVIKENRKTGYDLIGVLYNGQRVSVDSRIPNKLVLKALKNGDIEELLGYSTIKPEYNYGHTRFDFFLANEHERCLLEVKSCTLVKNGVALFPDAETERGRRHLMDLVKAKKEGYRTCVLFLVQRTDAKVFALNDETDPQFGKTLRSAAVEGDEVYAYYSEFSEDTIMLKGKIRVELSLTKSTQPKRSTAETT